MNKKINTGFLSNLVNDYRSKISEDTGIADIVTFSEANWGLSFNMFPMQKFILKTYYGLPLDNTEKSIPLPDELNQKTLGWFTEVEMMDYLIENKRTNIKEYVPGQTRRELLLVCGRRASKSNIVSLVCDYEAYRMIKLGNPQAYFGFPSGSEIDITTVASVDDQAATLFNMIKNRAIDCSFLKDRIQGSTQTYFSLLTDDDIKSGRDASIRVYCGGAGSSALRSKNNLVVVMDEAAHFSKVGKSSLYEVWQSLTPSVATFVPVGKTLGEGKIITLSSPFSKSGLFWDKYRESFDYPEDILMFQMYTAMINIRVDSAFLRSEQRKNKDLFRCEYGGEFSDTVEGWVDPEVLETVVDKNRNYNFMKGDPRTAYYMGIDFGGKNDGTSVAIVHREGESIVLDYVDVYYSASSDVWESVVPYYKDVNRTFSAEEIIPLNLFADEIKRLCEKFNVVEGWFDQFNGYGLLELLKERKLNQFVMKNVSSTLNIQVYQTAKSLINTGLLKLFNHPVLIPELASLEERKDGASMIVEAPQRNGFHDDISDALARAVWAAYNSKKDQTKKVAIGIVGTRSGTGTASYKAFQLDRFKKHGENPRSFGKFR